MCTYVVRLMHLHAFQLSSPIGANDVSQHGSVGHSSMTSLSKLILQELNGVRIRTAGRSFHLLLWRYATMAGSSISLHRQRDQDNDDKLTPSWWNLGLTWNIWFQPGILLAEPEPRVSSNSIVSRFSVSREDFHGCSPHTQLCCYCPFCTQKGNKEALQQYRTDSPTALSQQQNNRPTTNFLCVKCEEHIP